MSVNIIKDLHHLVEKQRFKHVKSLYYRAFPRCSWIKGPTFRPPMKAVGVHMLTCSQQGQIQTHDQEAWATSPACGRRKRPPFFLLVLPLNCWASGTSPQAGESTIPQGQALSSLTLDAGWGQAAALCSRTLHPQGGWTQGLPRALPWVQEYPAWPPHHAAPRCDLAHTASNLSFNHRYPLVRRDYVSY